MINSILKLSLYEIKKGYSCNPDKGIFTCLTCGKIFESGEMFSIDGRFYDASKAVQIHMQKEHEDMLDMLTSFDKKYTGITENQKELLFMIYKGMSDNDIAKKTGVAPATVRRQRFVFREKAKQAKLFLAIFEIVENKYLQRKEKAVDDELINVHAGAKMIDDRYLTTKSEEDKIIESLFESLEPLRLKIFSSKEKKKIVILSKIAEQFEKKRKYSEKEVNEILKGIYPDFATIRRYLIEYGYMERTKDCREYWLK